MRLCESSDSMGSFSTIFFPFPSCKTVVMAGIIAIYGLVVAILVAGGLDESGKYTLYK